MFNITRLYKDIKEPLDEMVVIEKNKYEYYFLFFYKIISEKITYGDCKNLKASLMNNIIKDIKINNNYSKLKDEYHNLIIDTILDKNFEKDLSKYILHEYIINLTVEICSAIVYKEPFYIIYVPSSFHDSELLEDAICLSPLNKIYLENLTISNLFYYYVFDYKPNRNRRYLHYILFEKCKEEISDKMFFHNNILSYIKDEEKTYLIEKKIVLSNPKNLEYSTLLNDDDIIEAIKKDKNSIFLIKKKILNYKIILETIKMYGNYLFLNGKKNKITLDFLTTEEYYNLKKELKIFYRNDRFTKKYIKMFNIIDLCMKNMLMSEET